MRFGEENQLRNKFREKEREMKGEGNRGGKEMGGRERERVGRISVTSRHILAVYKAVFWIRIWIRSDPGILTGWDPDPV